MSPGEIAQALKMDSVACRVLLHKMGRDGQIVHLYHGEYIAVRKYEKQETDETSEGCFISDDTGGV
jgi:hypothetical protein